VETDFVPLRQGDVLSSLVISTGCIYERTYQMSKTPYRYPGGKSKQKKLLRGYFPFVFEEFREPFAGGGVVFGIEREKKRWINDMNTDLIAVYLALRDRPTDFIQLCRSIPPAQPGEPTVLSEKGKPHNARLKQLFEAIKHDPTVDRALRYYYLNRTSFAGRVFLNPEMIDRLYYSNNRGWNLVTGDRLVKAAQHLEGVHITNGDFEPLFSTPGEECLIYADPPYVSDTETTRSGKLYQFGFTMEDHRRLADTIRACPHKVCLSYDDHPVVRELYRDFFIHEAQWKYCGSSRKEKKVGKELVITNYAVLAQKSMPAQGICISDDEVPAPKPDSHIPQN